MQELGVAFLDTQAKHAASATSCHTRSSLAGTITLSGQSVTKSPEAKTVLGHMYDMLALFSNTLQREGLTRVAGLLVSLHSTR